MSLGLMTKLQAVNRLLAATGDSPVQSLEENYQQAELALDTLNRVSRNEQAKGWFYNEEENLTLNKDTSDHVVLPANILKVEIRNVSKYVQRGLKIYDRENQTYVITEDVKADTVIQLDWDELPHVAREVIVSVAALTFYKDFFGAESTSETILQEIRDSKIALQKADVEARKVNLLGGSRVQNIAFSNRR